MLNAKKKAKSTTPELLACYYVSTSEHGLIALILVLQLKG